MLASSSSPDEMKYIGVTKMKLQLRLNNHNSRAKTVDTRCYRWMRDVYASGASVIIQPLVSNLSDRKAAIAEESRQISIAREAGIQLTNMTDGGIGTKSLKRSAQTKLRHSVAKIGKKQSCEHVQRRMASIRNNRLTRSIVEQDKSGRPGKNICH